jgi:NAD(P)H-hydrate epimerase
MPHPASRTPSCLSVKQSRQIDSIAVRDFGILSLVLMENAGRGAADHIAHRTPSGSSIAILCGTGNNGGDGLVIARHLHYAGFRVSVWLLGDPQRLTEDAATNLRILERTSIPLHRATSQLELPDAARFDVIVDAMLGTGARGEPTGWIAQAIAWANNASALRIAIDVPTGLDADHGTHSNVVFIADATTTFVAEKLGYRHPTAARVLGQVTVLPIGIPPEVIDLVLTGDTTREL